MTPETTKLLQDTIELLNGVLFHNWREAAKDITQRAKTILQTEVPPTNTQPDHPEHERLALVSDKSQIVGEFLEWLPTQGITLCTFHYGEHTYYHATQSITQLLAKFFDIDLDKIETEKRAMLDNLRQKNIIT